MRSGLSPVVNLACLAAVWLPSAALAAPEEGAAFTLGGGTLVAVVGFIAAVAGVVGFWLAGRLDRRGKLALARIESAGAVEQVIDPDGRVQLTSGAARRLGPAALPQLIATWDLDTEERQRLEALIADPEASDGLMLHINDAPGEDLEPGWYRLSVRPLPAPHGGRVWRLFPLSARA